jgi:hypothetical protein
MSYIPVKLTFDLLKDYKDLAKKYVDVAKKYVDEVKKNEDLVKNNEDLVKNNEEEVIIKCLGSILLWKIMELVVFFAFIKK